jgi:hypothetical protein
MTLDSFFTHFLAFILGAATIAMLIRMAAQNFIDRLMAQVDTDLESDLLTRRVEIEVVDNQILCYNEDTKEFICQGQDLLQVIDRFKERFPGTYDVKLVPVDDTTREWAQTQLKKINETSTSI